MTQRAGRAPTCAAGPAIIHFQQVVGPFWQLIVLGIAAVELTRARRGWVEPWKALFTLREEYTPGMRDARAKACCCRARCSPRRLLILCSDLLTCALRVDRRPGV
jgi:hypothetical protein